ncbi:hypothetical protein CHU95_12140 [Niveispirillum lacus]|uniref:Type VI secretion protein n=1 Tax=Niveispirillum lacus TaxID=1981099 RepID=A0A255YYE4_9PROT|nr:type VI secretion system baseplate subunit TssG [Niveispirillum lacus]OYQ34199.1 hypothetical protein CHU95_12140 [Niveispirillum lacus]
MATQGGHTRTDLTRLLRDTPQSFELDQLFRLWHLSGEGDLTLPAMRGLGFALGDAMGTSIEGEGSGMPAMVAFAITGPAGLLPRHLTARLALEARAGDTALADFLDMMSSRFTTLAHLGWRRSDPAALREQDEGAALAPLLALAGMGTEGFPALVTQGAAGIDADGIAYFAAILGAQPRSADGLARLLSGVLCLPVELVQFHGGWLTLPSESLARLGGSRPLSQGPALGQRRWEVQSRLAIIIGPVAPEWISRTMLAGDESTPLEWLRRLTRLYLGSGFSVDLRIRVRTEAIPEVTDPPTPRRLGLDSWMGRPKHTGQVEDCRFHWQI